MNSSVINSSLPFDHSSSGSSLQPSNEYSVCIESDIEYAFQFAVMAVNILLGYPANIMVIRQVAREKSDSSTANIFIFNLAITDAFFCLIIPINILGYMIFSAQCFVYSQLFAYGIKNFSPLLLTCICLDRYMAVVHPIVYTGIKDNKIRMAISILVSGLMLVYAFCRIFWLNQATNIFMVLILAIFTIMVFCNVSIMWSLRKSVLGKEKMHPMKKRACRTVQITLAIIVFLYLPIAALLPLRHKRLFPEFCQVEICAISLMHLSSSAEPALYISKNKQLLWLKKLLCICCRSPSPEPHNVST